MRIFLQGTVNQYVRVTRKEATDIKKHGKYRSEGYWPYLDTRDPEGEIKIGFRPGSTWNGWTSQAPAKAGCLTFT